MKTISIAFVLVAATLATRLFAQEYKIPVENSKDGKLTLNDFMGDFTVTGYDGKEIIISPASSDDEVKVPDRAKGLKPIYGRGVDNTGLGLRMEKNGNQVTLDCLLPITKRREYSVKVPNNFSVKIVSDCGRSGDITVQDVKNEVEVKNCQNIVIRNVAGSLVLSTISGDIEADNCVASNDQTISINTVSGDVKVKFSEFKTTSPVSLTTVSGEVDVTLPAKASVNLKMRTISGELYSDFEFPDTGKKMKQVGGNHVSLNLNGGGTELSLGTVSGNVYLRKEK